jgi:transcriptional regulator
MYIPKHFIVDDDEVLFNFIEKNSFGIIFSIDKGNPVATHLPFTLDRENGYLYGHFARPNMQWNDIEKQEIMVVFQGPHSYISSSWYETNLSVPTWNYIAVHVYGNIEIMDDGKELLETLNKMVAKYEDANSSYRLDDTNHELIDGLMKGIVGFKLKISKMEGKWKLSQNHSRERQQRVIEKLEQIRSDNAQEIANLMKENHKESVS